VAVQGMIRMEAAGGVQIRDLRPMIVPIIVAHGTNRKVSRPRKNRERATTAESSRGSIVAISEEPTGARLVRN
jgi:hypothetical protein